MASDAVIQARERIAARCADLRVRGLGLDKDLQSLGEALTQLRRDQAYIAHCMAHICPLVHCLLFEHLKAGGLIDAANDPALRMLVDWQSRLRQIAGDQ